MGTGLHSVLGVVREVPETGAHGKDVCGFRSFEGGLRSAVVLVPSPARAVVAPLGAARPAPLPASDQEANRESSRVERGVAAST